MVVTNLFLLLSNMKKCNRHPQCKYLKKKNFKRCKPNIYCEALLNQQKQTIRCRSSHPEVFLRKGILKICIKFIGENPCRSVVSRKMQSNFIEIARRHGCSSVNLLDIFRIPFPRKHLGGCF